MKPCFANSAWVPVREHLVLSGGRRAGIRLRVRYGLIVHPKAGPVLVDTGYTPHACNGSNRSPALRWYCMALRPELNDAEQPGPLLTHFGLKPEDVRYVIVSHFHADHISGLCLFPAARFITSKRAWSRIKRRSILGNLRHGIFPELLPEDFESRLIDVSSFPRTRSFHGLPEGTDLFGDGSMIAIDLPGHADDHFGIVFETTDKPLLYGVDAEWMLRAIMEERPPGYPARLIASDCSAAGATRAMLSRFLERGGDVLLCHDPESTAHDFISGVVP